MPDYRLFQKEQTVRAVNTERQDQQDALMAEGYKMVWDVVHADNADAVLLRAISNCVTKRIMLSRVSQPIQFQVA
ncbi:hypothetical protein [Pantoea agglomerans]|uniref:hypothetical protein n=1 Tax=Enterobacter agglomerans TaxID=549 RepID=UPI0032081411